MAQTVLITGSSSGIGKATVDLFANKGWNVAATMRNPNDQPPSTLPNVKYFQLDVTDVLSIARCTEAVLNTFGTIHVIVNNAGYGAMGAFELATDAQIQAQFNTNVFGAMRLIKSVLPTMRAQQMGTIINVTSVAGRTTSPLYSLYCSSKYAIEGFTESLYYELRPWNIKVKLIEPGPIKTEFNGRSKVEINNDQTSPYNKIHQKVKCFYDKLFDSAPEPIVVAKVIYKAANSRCNRLRYVAGSMGKLIIFMNKITPLWKVRLLQRITIGI